MMALTRSWCVPSPAQGPAQVAGTWARCSIQLPGWQPAQLLQQMTHTSHQQAARQQEAKASLHAGLLGHHRPGRR